jgi:mRNA interferase HicA
MDLVKHLREQGCELLREGRSHSFWVNPGNEQQASVPRHREIKRLHGSRHLSAAWHRRAVKLDNKRPLYNYVP